MITEGAGMSYRSTEKPFIDYFNRLKAAGISNREIRLTNLPQLENYYFDMVIKGVIYYNIPTVEDLFNKWKDN
jgi:hypothetical protein